MILAKVSRDLLLSFKEFSGPNYTNIKKLILYIQHGKYGQKGKYIQYGKYIQFGKALLRYSFVKFYHRLALITLFCDYILLQVYKLEFLVFVHIFKSFWNRFQIRMKSPLLSLKSIKCLPLNKSTIKYNLTKIIYYIIFFL